MSPDRPARERPRWAELQDVMDEAVCNASDADDDISYELADAVLDHLPLVLEAAREAGKVRKYARWDGQIALVGLPVQNEPDQETR